MTWWAKRLQHKGEGLSLIPWTHINAECDAHICDLSAGVGRQRQETMGTSEAWHSRQTCEIQDQWETVLQNISWREVEGGQSWPLASLCTHMGKHTYMYISIPQCIHVVTHRKKLQNVIVKHLQYFYKAFQIFTCIINSIHFEILLIFYDFWSRVAENMWSERWAG